MSERVTETRLVCSVDGEPIHGTAFFLDGLDKPLCLQHGYEGLLRERDAEIAALKHQVEKRPGWQPIETAPLNEDVLAYLPDRGVIRARCLPTETGREWWFGVVQFYPTHWMPLPSPPIVEGANENGDLRQQVAQLTACGGEDQ